MKYVLIDFQAVDYSYMLQKVVKIIHSFYHIMPSSIKKRKICGQYIFILQCKNIDIKLQ